MNRVIAIILLASLYSCVDKIDFPIDESNSPQLVVEGGLHADTTIHEIILSRSGKVVGEFDFQPVSGADMWVSDGSVTVVFIESETNPGYYYSEELEINNNLTYHLQISLDGMIYEAFAKLVAPYDFEPIEYYPASGGPILGENPQGFYAMDLPGNFGSGEPYLYYLSYDVPSDWKDDFPYPIPPGYIDWEAIGLIDTTYLVHPWLEIAAMFEYGETTVVGLPLGTKITERRYYITDDYYEYLRAVLLETDWRGANILQSIPANVPTNISNGALGYFYALDSYEVVSYIEE